MRARIEVGHRVHSLGAKDAHGNQPSTWADPVPLKVYSIVPRTSSEPDPTRPAVVTGRSLFAPAGTFVNPRDRFVIDGEEWEVDGEVSDYTRGPFGYTPGVVIDLKREEG